MVFHMFSKSFFGGSEIPNSLNLSSGWPSSWRAKVMVFHMFSKGFWRLRNSEVAELKLRLAFRMESKSNGFPYVFQKFFWRLRNSEFVELKLRLALIMESKSNGFPYVFQRFLAAEKFRSR